MAVQEHEVRPTRRPEPPRLQLLPYIPVEPPTAPRESRLPTAVTVVSVVLGVVLGGYGLGLLLGSIMLGG